MEFSGELLKLNCLDPDDRRIMSDISLAIARTVYDHGRDGDFYPFDPELTNLGQRIDASYDHLQPKSKVPKPILELDIDEIQVCASLFEPAIRTHAESPLPVESMQQTRMALLELIGDAA